MTDLLDQAKEQRSSERLDQNVLQTYLQEQNVIDSPITSILQFSGGASNLTYRVQTQNQDLILRRPPFGHKAKTAHDMKREVTVLNALSPRLDVCPKALHYCDDEAIMGSEFYLMERIQGVIIRRDMPQQLTAQSGLYADMCTEFATRLVELHSLDPAEVGLQEFGKPEGYVSRQVLGWTKRMQNAKTSNTLSFDALAAWLVEQMPKDHPHSAIIHNDYKFDNVIWDEQSLVDNKPKMIGVLDWEMTTLGDPLMDLGSTLAYWVEASDPPPLIATGMMPTHLAGMLTRSEFSNAYLAARGWASQDLSYYRIFGLFRLAVIVQQIYYRFDLGQTDNPRFASFGDLANLLIHTAARAAKV
ncbi:MAG: phosphotransferase family protein [Gammaproteobacteria bacterium]